MFLQVVVLMERVRDESLQQLTGENNSAHFVEMGAPGANVGLLKRLNFGFSNILIPCIVNENGNQTVKINDQSIIFEHETFTLSNA